MGIWNQIALHNRFHESGCSGVPGKNIVFKWCSVDVFSAYEEEFIPEALKDTQEFIIT